MDTIAIVTDHVRPWVERAAIAAYGLGLEPAVVLGCEDCDATGFGGPVLNRVAVQDPDAVVVAVAGLGVGVGVLSWDDGLIVPVAQAADRLGVPHPRLDGLQRVRNKGSMRRRLAALGVPGPRFATATGPEDGVAVGDAVGFPAIVKPVNGTGSALVRRADDAAELVDALRDLTGLPEGALGGLLDRQVPDPDGDPVLPRRAVLVEERLVGPEIDVEVVVRGGLAVPVLTSEVGFTSGTFREAYFVHPPVTADAATTTSVLAQVSPVLSALEVDDCVVNMTFIVTEDRGPLLVEVNAGRPGGHLLAAMAWHVSGVDLTAEAVATACGAPRPDPSEPSGDQVAALSFYPSAYGKISAVHGLEAVREHPDVLTVVQMAAIGERFVETHTLYTVAALVREGGSAERLHNLHAELEALVTIDVDA